MNLKKYQVLDSFLNISAQRMEKAALYTAGPGIAAIYSCSSPVDDNPNQDQAAILPISKDILVLIVADGAGGHADGDSASARVIIEIKKAINASLKNGGEIREAILSGIENANRSIIENLSGAASTVALVEIQNESIRTYHAGDSEVLVTGLRGKIRHQILKHSPVGYAEEAGLLDESQAIMHEERHIVSNILGFDDMHITVSTSTKLNSHDTLIVGTDGLFDNLQKEEIIEIIRKGPLHKCAGSLIEKVNHRMNEPKTDEPSKFDDMSFILFRLKK